MAEGARHSETMVTCIQRCMLLLTALFTSGIPAPHSENADTWRQKGLEELKRVLGQEPLETRAKNVILFVGDGMSTPTLTAARILQGGTGGELAFEKFPYTSVSKTYCTDRQVTDSAAAATALMTGVKTNMGVLGLDQSVKRGQCSGQKNTDTHLTSILDWSLAAGKSVGLVTTTRVTHATPAAGYANIAERDWEGDSELPQSEEGCRDIARQLVEDYPNMQVVLGGGRRYFTPRDQKDESGESYPEEGRGDGRHLIQEWLKGEGSRHYVWNRTSLNDLDLNSVDHLLGLFSESHMEFEIDRSSTDQPSLAEMTEAAIKILSKNNKGYFLLVEGGRIDHAHHAGNAFRALHETLALSDTVAKVVSLTDVNETLMVVTADHAHTMIMAGYPSRDNPIFNVVDTGNDDDDRPYTTLLYGTGPGYSNDDSDVLTNDITNDKDYMQTSAVPIDPETHGGDDVLVYANGPMAHLFRGIHEETYTAHVMAYASCVGHFADNCDLDFRSGKR